MKNYQKTMATVLAVAMLAAGLSGCNGGGGKEDGKVSISIGSWPDETNPNGQKTYDEYLKQMNEKYPDVKVIPDVTGYADAKIFQMKAAANQLPTMYQTHFTEIQQIIKGGYAADITDVMDKYGVTEGMNPELLKLVKGEDGRVYAYPTNAYIQGLTINQAIFKEAGLVNADGSIKIPNTYDEMVEYAKIIKEKTGKAGYAICTTNNCGGWHFMNIAWNYGVEFMKQRDDGSWEATFNTPECVEALQYVKDLKWKYDALPDESVINQADAHKFFGVGQVAMIFEGPSNDYSQKYGMNVDDLVVAKMPAGPKGRYVQMGGSVKMFSKTATPEQLEACFDWLGLTGFSVKMDEQAIENKKKSYQNTLDQNGLVLPKAALPLWSDEERVAQEAEIAKEYTNVDAKNFENYYDLSDVTLKPEEPVMCQQLYAVLDGCIQEVITNQNADPAQLIETACKDFQTNHLDKQE